MTPHEIYAHCQADVDPAREYTVIEARALLGLHPNSVRLKLRAHTLPARRQRIGVNKWRYVIRGADIIAFARRRAARAGGFAVHGGVAERAGT